jgi:hypothetical protein
MCDGINPLNGEPQSFYLLEDHPTMKGWFKGMEQIIWERGLWPEAGLPAECPTLQVSQRSDKLLRPLPSFQSG